MLELLCPVRPCTDVLEPPCKIHPAKLIRHTIERVELTNLLQIPRTVSGFLLEFMHSRRQVVAAGLHASAGEFQAFLITEVAVLLHQHDLAGIQNGDDEARSVGVDVEILSHFSIRQHKRVLTVHPPWIFKELFPFERLPAGERHRSSKSKRRVTQSPALGFRSYAGFRKRTAKSPRIKPFRW